MNYLNSITKRMIDQLNELRTEAHLNNDPEAAEKYRNFLVSNNGLIAALLRNIRRAEDSAETEQTEPSPTTVAFTNPWSNNSWLSDTINEAPVMSQELRRTIDRADAQTALTFRNNNASAGLSIRNEPIEQSAFRMLTQPRGFVAPQHNYTLAKRVINGEGMGQRYYYSLRTNIGRNGRRWLIVPLIPKFVGNRSGGDIESREYGSANGTPLEVLNENSLRCSAFYELRDAKIYLDWLRSTERILNPIANRTSGETYIGCLPEDNLSGWFYHLYVCEHPRGNPPLTTREWDVISIVHPDYHNTMRGYRLYARRLYIEPSQPE